MTGPRRDDVGASATETVVSVGVLMIIFALMLSVYSGQVHRADEGILRAQLRALRMQAKLFKVVRGRWPRDTRELVQDSLSIFPLGAADLPEEPASKLLKPGPVLAVAADGDGYPIDPWGNRFVYERLTGHIRPGTEDYESW
ncbi:MAG TPA: hypothetical protein ENH32_02115 [Proteobacteria bacterium]|nr:hypothetical protein BMS3Abin14_00954 [bacterium BMS3Abin14]HDL52751.1 hypothetical protein [Pseudomonadota bacterium]